MTRETGVVGLDVEIRPLREDDEDILFQFFRSLSEKTVYYFEPHPFDRNTAKRLASEASTDKSTIRFLATIREDSGEKAVGYAFLWKLDRDLPSIGIGVADDYQGRGLGKVLMQALLAKAREIGKKRLRLSVCEANEAAISLYRKMGFTLDEGDDARYYNKDRGAYWVHMVRELVNRVPSSG